MNRLTLFPYFLIGLFLLGWTSLSQPVSDQMRSWAVSKCSFAWHCADGIQKYLSDRPIIRCKQDVSSELMELKLENQNLKAQLEQARQWIFHEQRLQVLHEFANASDLNRRRAHLFDRLHDEARAVIARVIYRDPTAWSGSLWIHAGEEDNRAIGDRIIAKNSPVVDGGALIGVIDYVGESQSRVRLITDSSLSLAVRAVRGNLQHREIAYFLEGLSESIKNLEKEPELAIYLDKIKKTLKVHHDALYLAKGVLHGCGAPFWQAKHPLLKGVGFNYDYADSEGPARDLRTGCSLDVSHPSVPLIHQGDLLVTSGLDGIFPPGLSVALVTTVFPLKEGNFSYEIQARPTAYALNDLKEVFVLPSLSCE